MSKRSPRWRRGSGCGSSRAAPRGASLTPDGAAFLPYARELLRAETRALDAVRAGRRPLRVDVIGRRLAPAGLLHAFSLAHPEVVLDVVTLEHAVPALREGSVDASFRAVPAPLAGLAHVRVHDEPVELVTGPAHPLATAPEVSPAMLVGHRVWIPGPRARHRVGHLLRRSGRRLRPHDRPLGPRRRTPPRHPRPRARARDPRRRGHPPPLAPGARPAPRPAHRPDPRLPPRPRLAPRQPPPRARHPARVAGGEGRAGGAGRRRGGAVGAGVGAV
ncbi:LOW QUALITY PROTEIN: LysR-type transcriptional regulator, partial [Streptomyces sp. SPB78]